MRENGSIIESYKYDNYGNPTHFKSGTQNMWWERGTLLSRYGDIHYTYDAYGKLTKKQAGSAARLYYDGDRLIAMEIGREILRFFYDIEGVAGFKKGTGARYTYVKDGQGNVLGLADEDGLVSKYIYDAWGQCKAADANGNEITDRNSAALLNPFRWKSQYYDEDSGLYYIEGRWYDPERGRYISSDSPENPAETDTQPTDYISFVRNDSAYYGQARGGRPDGPADSTEERTVLAWRQRIYTR